MAISPANIRRGLRKITRPFKASYNERLSVDIIGAATAIIVTKRVAIVVNLKGRIESVCIQSTVKFIGAKDSHALG